MSPFVVTRECLSLGLRAGAILIRNTQIETSSSELRSLIDQEAQRIRQSFASLAEVRSQSGIARIREIIRNVGVKPKNHPPSTQKLLEYAWKHGTLPSINNLVDTYNLVSLQTLCSLGAHDFDLISPPVELRLFRGDESFRPIGGDEETRVDPGEFGYVDAENQIVCRLDSRQAEFSKVTASTSNVLLIVESTNENSREKFEEVMSATQSLLARFCPADFDTVAVQ